MNGARYYSMRRLSPYQGTVQVVETPGFRAITSDGLTWRVQYLHRRSRFAPNMVWRRDGSGNLTETEETREFIEAMKAHPAFPFPAADNLELWLLDAKDHKPLAILASTFGHVTPPRTMDTVWHAALVGDNSFIASSLSAGGAAGASPVPHRDVLDRCVQKAAGALDRAQWFRREDDGGGTGLHGCRVDSAQVGRKLERAAFPELLLREDWEDERERNLVRDYHDWQAPHLLTHRQLTHATRDRLERAACRQTEKLYKVRHFLPEIVNPDLLKVAFVEAVIRRSNRP
ncbi:MAG: hypothetical protein ACM3NI_06405 [Bacteroidota bacterium]